MRLAYIFIYLLPVLCTAIDGVAQDSERILKNAARLLAINGVSQTRFYSGTKREKARLDTLTATEDNYRFKAYNYTWQKDYEQTADWLEKMTVRLPKMHGVAGELYLNHFRDYIRALRHFEAYDALTPTFDDIIGYNPVSYMQGLAWRGLGDHSKAITLFSKAIDSLAIKHGPEWVNYKHYVSRAVSYIEIQQPEKALIDLDRAAKNFTRSSLVQYHRGRALLLLNRREEARSAFQDASFFAKALRAERNGDYLEDSANPVYESEIDEALASLKNLR